MSQKQPFVGTVAKAVLPDVLAGAVRSAITAELHNNAPLTSALESGTIAVVADQIIHRLEANPVVVNEVNAEKPVQSRVAVGATTAAVGVILQTLGPMLGFDGGYIFEVLMAVLTLWGAIYALYGRFKTGLLPLFSRGGFLHRLFSRGA